MLVEKSESEGRPDWFGIAWYGFLAAYCIYGIATGAKELPYLVTGPLYFSIVIFGFFFAVALVVGLLSQLLAFAARRKVFGVEPLPMTAKTIKSFFILPVMVFSLMAIAWYFFDKMGKDYSGELGSFGALAVFSITFLQAAIASVPRVQDGSGWRSYAEKWFKEALKSIFVPSFVGVIAILAGLFAMSLLFGTENFEAHVYRFSFYFAAIFFILYRLFLEKAGKSLRDDTDRKEWRKKFLYLLLGSLLAAAALHLPITYLAEGMSQVQTKLAVFFFAYIFLVYAQTMPKWYASMMQEKKGANEKADA